MMDIIIKILIFQIIILTTATLCQQNNRLIASIFDTSYNYNNVFNTAESFVNVSGNYNRNPIIQPNPLTNNMPNQKNEQYDRLLPSIFDTSYNYNNIFNTTKSIINDSGNNNNNNNNNRHPLIQPNPLTNNMPNQKNKQYDRLIESPTVATKTETIINVSNNKYNQSLNSFSDVKANPCSIGKCVPFYQCKEGAIVTDGDGLLDIRIGGDNDDDDDDNNKNNKISPCPGLLETCCTLESEEKIIPSGIVQNVGCGYRNINGVGFRITSDNENEAQFGEFPWMVAILKEDIVLDKILNVYQCGGSLIQSNVVLTAAHCVYAKNPKLLKIRAGEWDTQTIDELFPHQDQYVSEIIIHENFHIGSLRNDIALLILKESFIISENVNTICLPPQNENFDDARCFASGWGKDLFEKEGTYRVILKRLELPIVKSALCERILSRTRLGTRFRLHYSFICAGGEAGVDTCKGDGGSPLVCPISGTQNRYYQAGMVAWGIGCNNPIPGVYVNVAMFKNWIDQQLSYKNITTTSYTF